MTCKLTMTLISENQVGNIGEDWKYEVEAKVFTEGLQGQGIVQVPKHHLASDVVAVPHGSPPPQVLFTGQCADGLLVRLHLKATEVDMFINDVGKADKDLRIECPGPAGGTVTKEVDIAAGVRESPGILPKNAVFTVRVRLTLACE